VPAAKPLFSDVLTLDGIAGQRGGRMLFSGFSLSLAPGAAAILTGPNGAGKSSLLRIVAGALPSFAGQVLWNGESFLENGHGVHARRFAFVPPDDRALKLLETVGETLSFWARLRDLPHAAIGHGLAAMGLGPLRDTPVRLLSAGQRRRLSVARALMQEESPLWLFDEPFNGLDAAAEGLFLSALLRHRARGGMALIASHHPAEVQDARRVPLAGGAA